MISFHIISTMLTLSLDATKQQYSPQICQAWGGDSSCRALGQSWVWGSQLVGTPVKPPLSSSLSSCSCLALQLLVSSYLSYNPSHHQPDSHKLMKVGWCPWSSTSWLKKKPTANPAYRWLTIQQRETINMYIYIYINIYIYMCMYIHRYIHIYIYTGFSHWTETYIDPCTHRLI